MSDILGGAAIGIIGGELGYFFGDMIFKDKGKNKISRREYALQKYKEPSFIGLTMSAYLPKDTVSGTSIGLEGAYFLSPYIGFGGKWSISDPHYTQLAAGVYGSYPFTNRLFAGAKVLMGNTLSVGASGTVRCYEHLNFNLFAEYAFWSHNFNPTLSLGCSAQIAL